MKARDIPSKVWRARSLRRCSLARPRWLYRLPIIGPDLMRYRYDQLMSHRLSRGTNAELAFTWAVRGARMGCAFNRIGTAAAALCTQIGRALQVALMAQAAREREALRDALRKGGAE